MRGLADHSAPQLAHTAVTRLLCTRTVPSRNYLSFASEATRLHSGVSTVAAVAQEAPSDSAGARQAGTPSTSAPQTLKEEVRQDRIEVCDKLITVFSAKSPDEWRKLIAASKQWPLLCDSVFQRIEQRALDEPDKDSKAALRKMGRRLRSVHEELAEYNSLIELFLGAPDFEWETLVATRRPALTQAFFTHLQQVIRLTSDVNQRQDLVTVGSRLAALRDAYDQVSEDKDAVEAARASFAELLQAESLEDADKRIDEMAASGRLDPALMLTMAKAYATAKETDVTKEEVKDIMVHLWLQAKKSFARQQPPEVRILKHLLSLEDPAERRAGVASAFEPGPAVSQWAKGDTDYLSTTPPQLLKTIDAILAAYDTSRGSDTMAGQAGSLMNPLVIERMRALQGVIRSEFT
ncbi:hypothetical protein WJX73_005207 [Symbiochloris irregularis]|uniref:Uncharacterized protein n=1 Tax=Symbiochloris irregularis TaxID=706552 RepID=A0AAW1PE78_9CHLO